jgi:lactoylglutathione lyase
MKVERNGIILNTERYEECVAFYKDTLNLTIMFQLKEEHSYLTCFEFGGAYLMVEKEGIAKDSEKSMSENPTKLRFNVSNIDDARDHLTKMGIAAIVNRQVWGSTINISDPDGNRIGIRDESGFKNQIQLKSGE